MCMTIFVYRDEGIATIHLIIIQTPMLPTHKTKQLIRTGITNKAIL